MNEDDIPNELRESFAQLNTRPGMRARHWILEGTEPQPCHDWLLWAIWYEKSNRRIAMHRVRGVCVSTVFLGLDHGWGDGPPILFETMVFGGFFHDYQRRYATYEDADAGHREALRRVARWSWCPLRVQNALRIAWEFWRYEVWGRLRRDWHQLADTVRRTFHMMRL